MTRPAASVIVPSFRGADRLPVLFDALRRQTFDGEWEVLVVLDGVVDASPAVVAAAGDLPIRLIELPENRGRPAALNAGFAAARGEVLVRCDDDLGVAPSFVANHVAAHHRRREPTGIVGLCRDVLPDNAYARTYGRPANERFRAAAYASSPEGWWKYWAANCSVTAETFARVGGYDERFRVYGWEDVDWGYRLHQLGIPVVLDPTLEVVHLAASSNVAIRVERAFFGGQARARFDEKHRVMPVGPVPSSPAEVVWTTAVGLAARQGSVARFRSSSTALDRRLDRLPPALAARLVAFLVEAAALAGHATPDDTPPA